MSGWDRLSGFAVPGCKLSLCASIDRDLALQLGPSIRCSRDRGICAGNRALSILLQASTSAASTLQGTGLSYKLSGTLIA
jgi:hypothetical protein